MKHKFKHLVVGGTFDLLHKGHEGLIEFAVARSQRVTIGLTSDKMAQIKNPNLSYKQRFTELKSNLSAKNLSTVTIVKIDDLYGVATKDKSIDGIVVTEETRAGADKVNARRKKFGLETLPMIVAPTIMAKDGIKISSSRIRSGDISRDGLVYWQQLKGKNLLLPDKLRPSLSAPFGPIIENEPLLARMLLGSLLIVAVGDEVTRTLNRLGVAIDLTIIDFKINRKKQIEDLGILGVKKGGIVAKVNNPAGTIGSALTDSVAKYFEKSKQKETIIVNGEEDLAVIPVILLSPLGTKIVYGQREKGAVVISVDEQMKEKILKLVEKFKTF